MSSGGTATAAAAAAAAAKADSTSDPFCFNVRRELQKSKCSLAESDKAYTEETTGVAGAPKDAMVRELAQSLAVSVCMTDNMDLATLLLTKKFAWIDDPFLGGGAKDQGLWSSLRNCTVTMVRKEVIEFILAAPTVTGVNKKTVWELCQACVAHKVQSEQRRPKAST